MSGRRPRRGRGAAHGGGSPGSPGSQRRSAAARPRRSGGGRPQDHFGELAKERGYPARAVFKLEEIDRRVRLLRRGLRVLDLGAAPGSWSLYAGQRVGREGRVLGIDLQEITIAAPEPVEFRQLDLRDPENLAEIGEFDVVLSDMAPSTSGMRHRDQYLSFELFSLALEACDHALVGGGHFVGKIFQGAEFAEARAATAERFERVRIFKPEASRDESYEVFLVGLSKRTGPSATPPQG